MYLLLQKSIYIVNFFSQWLIANLLTGYIGECFDPCAGLIFVADQSAVTGQNTAGS